MMQPNLLMMSPASGTPQSANPQPNRNRKRSARVPRLEATRLEVTDAWLNHSQELSLAEATGTMRVNIETLVRDTILDIAPDLPGKIHRALQARRAGIAAGRAA
jgi:hypothetical protein